MVILRIGMRFSIPTDFTGELAGRRDRLACTTFFRSISLSMTKIDLSTALTPRKLDPLWADRPLTITSQVMMPLLPIPTSSEKPSMQSIRSPFTWPRSVR